MFRPWLAIFRFLQYRRGIYKCCTNCEGGSWLIDLYINPLTTLFLVQELFVNMEKNYKQRKIRCDKLCFWLNSPLIKLPTLKVRWRPEISLDVISILCHLSYSSYKESGLPKSFYVFLLSPLDVYKQITSAGIWVKLAAHLYCWLAVTEKAVEPLDGTCRTPAGHHRSCMWLAVNTTRHRSNLLSSHFKQSNSQA